MFDQWVFDWRVFDWRDTRLAGVRLAGVRLATWQVRALVLIAEGTKGLPGRSLLGGGNSKRRQSILGGESLIVDGRY